MKTVETLTDFVDYFIFYLAPNEPVEANFAGRRGDNLVVTFLRGYQFKVKEISPKEVYAIKNQEGESSIPGFEGKYDIVKKE